MTAREIHLEDLLYRKVRDADGRIIGRIEEFKSNDEGEIIEFELGPAALLKRLIGHLGFSGAQPIRIPWPQLDLTHPERPTRRGEHRR